jgi:hypothetical protein
VEAEIFDFIELRKLNNIDFNRWAGCTLNSEGDMCRIGFIDFHPPSFEPNCLTRRFLRGPCRWKGKQAICFLAELYSIILFFYLYIKITLSSSSVLKVRGSLLLKGKLL